MRSLIRTLPLLLAGLIGLAQTGPSGVPLDQLRVRGVKVPGGLWAVWQGALTIVEIGEGLSLTAEGGRLILRVSPVVTVVAETSVRGADLAVQPDGSYSLPATPLPIKSLAVYRNGVRQKVGLDYSLDPQNTRRVVALLPWKADDVLLADYSF